MAQGSLCILCREITLENLLPAKSSSTCLSLIHHKSFGSLVYSALQGCALCALFQHAVYTEYESRRGWSPYEVTRYHYELDEADLDQYYVFAVELTWLWSRSYREGSESRRFNGLCYARHVRRKMHNNDEDQLSIYTTADTFGRGYQNQILPWLSLTTSRMDHPYIIGRAVPERPDIELCQEWIAKCSSEHAICAKIEDAALPTRLLDVGSGASTHPRLVFTNNLQKGRYAALSHCWGSTVTLCTTTENVARHAVCMPFDNLPLTFRHAVSVTRLLGLTYLWIDSLCILQDSPEDWQAECRRMEQIYENAAVVIAGPAAASSASGFYFSRPMSVIPPIRLPGNEHDDLLVGLSRVSSASERIPPTEKDSILTTRGWIVQERLLAQRVLYFGSHQFYMECDHTSHFESSWEAIDSRDDYTKGMVNCSRGKMALMRWYRTVEIYTACNITRATDRLPALAGLARRYAKLVQDTYLAGLWRNYVIHGLQWCLHGGPSGLRLGTHRGPSWSWASLDDPVSYDIVDLLHRSPVRYHPLVEIRSAFTETSGLDDFGEVSSGCIQLSGQLLPFTVRASPWSEAHHSRTSSGTVVYQGHDVADFWPDYQDWETVMAEEDNEAFCLPLATCSSGKIFGCCGIAIERIAGGSNEHVYRRLGLFYAGPREAKFPCSCNLTAVDHAFLWAAHPVHHSITLI